jgi:hypothetical protein
VDGLEIPRKLLRPFTFLTVKSTTFDKALLPHLTTGTILSRQRSHTPHLTSQQIFHNLIALIGFLQHAQLPPPSPPPSQPLSRSHGSPTPSQDSRKQRHDSIKGKRVGLPCRTNRPPDLSHRMPPKKCLLSFFPSARTSGLLGFAAGVLHRALATELSFSKSMGT